MEGKDLAYWLADKIPACGDYAKQAAQVLRKQADDIERLQAELYVWRQMGQSLHDAGLRVVDVPNVELTGAARPYRAASSDRRERG